MQILSVDMQNQTDPSSQCYLKEIIMMDWQSWEGVNK